MKFKRLFIGVAAAAICVTTAYAADGEEIAMEKMLHGHYPATQITGVHKTGIGGLFEVDMGKNIGYTNSDGRFFIFGHIFDMKTQQDLTAQRLDELNVVNFAELPLKDAMRLYEGMEVESWLSFRIQIVLIARSWSKNCSSWTT